MKSFIALCCLAAICAVQASAYHPSDPSQVAVRSTKRNVGLNIAYLRRTKASLTNTAYQNLNTLTGRTRANIDYIVTLDLADIRARVDIAKAEGKDAENCYTTAQASAHSILGTTFPGLDTCKTNKTSIDAALAPLDKEIEGAQAFITQLDNVSPACYQSNTTQVQTCIVTKLKQINESIKTYRMNVNVMIPTVENNLNKEINTVSPCITGLETTARSAINDLKIAADTCITK